MDRARKWMRRRSNLDDGERSDGDDEEFGSNLGPARTTSHVSLERPALAVNRHRLSEPSIAHHAVNRNLSEPNVHIDRHGSELRFIAGRLDRSASSHLAHESPLGLTLVYCPPVPRLDVIFVHGLGGTSVGTWSYERDPKNFWPPWLANDSQLSHCRTFTFGYNASLATQYSSYGILDFAKDLLFKMRMFSGESAQDGPQIGTLPITFVTHSMGGLIVKKAYVIGKSDAHSSVILPKIKSIIFLGTPHKGSHYADMINNILKALPNSSAKQYVTDLAQNSTALQEINEQFRNICGDLELISFYETTRTSLGGGLKKIIVDKESSLLGYPGESSASLLADHHGLTKFRHQQDDNYITVRNLLRHVYRKYAQKDDVLDEGESEAAKEAPLPFPRDPSMDVDYGASSSSLNGILDGNISTVDVSMQNRLMEVLGITEAFKDEYEYFSDKTMDGTCQWLLDRQIFREWADTSSSMSGHLWLTGNPGAGKSTWAAFIVSWLRRHHQEDLRAYHFFQKNHQLKRSTSYLLRSIAFQHTLSSDVFRTRLLDLCTSSGLTFGQQKAAFIWDKIFKGVLFPCMPETPMFWIIDGLDESESTDSLLRLLTQIKSTAQVHVVFLSRPHKDIQQAMDQYFPRRVHEHIDPIDLLDDIGKYVRTSVKHISSSSHQDEVVDKVLRKAAGSFLWVRLALEKMKNDWHTHKGIDRALNSIPEGMEAMFRDMIKDIAAKPPDLRALAVRILSWIVCSFRPLTLEELSTALMPESVDFLDLATTVEVVCCQFVVINKGKVTLIHETARTFLLQKTSKLEIQISGPQSHMQAAERCMNLLSDDLTWKRRFESIQSGQLHGRIVNGRASMDAFPLLCYSLFNWSYHFSHSPVDADDLFESVLNFLDSFCLLWINGVALSGNFLAFIATAENLKTFLKRRAIAEKKLQGLGLTNSRDDQLTQWATDILRIIGRFGNNLRQEPSCIHKFVVPFCPEESIIHRSFASSQRSSFKVIGKWAFWSDCLARLSIGEYQSFEKILSMDSFLVGLVSASGTLVVWQNETFEELRRIVHREWVTCIAASPISSLIASAGQKTIRIWSVGSGEERLQLPKTDSSKVLALAFSADDGELYIGADDCTVECINTKTGRSKWVFTADDDTIRDYSRPSHMSFSSDMSQVAVIFRGKPVLTWKLRSLESPKKCVCSADRRTSRTSDEACNPAAMALWHPVTDHLAILYEDTRILYWNVADGTQTENAHTAAKTMTMSPNGDLLITSDTSGALSIWMVPEFRLTYRLESEDLVNDLAFTRDGARFCDIRGPFCNIWETDALVRANDLDEDDTSSTYETLITEPTISTDYKRQENETSASQASITAIVYGPADRYYGCGFDDGSVSLYEVASGKKVRNKVMSHEESAAVIQLAWSSGAEYLASADDSSRVIIKRLERPTKQKPKWAVFPVFDFRMDDAIIQLMFSCRSDLLLVTGPETVVVLNLRTKKEISRTHIVGMARWLTDRLRPETLLRTDGTRHERYSWADLITPLELDHPIDSTTVFQPLGQSPLTIERAFTTSANLWLFEVSVEASRKRIIQRLDPGATGSHPARMVIDGLSDHVSRLIGCLQDRVVFLDRDFWVCTWDLAPTYARHKRHFFLPQYLLSPLTLDLIRVTRDGTLLCPQGRDVVIIRSDMYM